MVPCRQTKDQSKKVASLKQKEHVEKSRNAQLMDEAKKREDNISESSQQVKVRCGWGGGAVSMYVTNVKASLVVLNVVRHQYP